MRSDLKMFGAADLYEYACPANSQNPQLATNEELVERAEQRVDDWMRNTSERSAAERLRSRAREVFGDDAERRRYDEYLQWCDLKAVFDGLDERMDPATSSCTDAEVAPEIARLRELLGSKHQAEALMESYLANRGIELLDSHVAQVSTAQGRAEVREELAAVNMLPDSALQPSTPPPPTQPIVVGAAAPAVSAAPAGNRQQAAGAQVGVIRRCACGHVNSADQNYCQACGRQLEGTTTLPPIARGAAGVPKATVAPVVPSAAAAPAASRRQFPVAAVIVSLVFIAVIAGALAFFFMSGAADQVLGGQRSEQASSESAKNTKRIQSGSVNAVSCSGKTVITPYDVDEQPLEVYTVQLKRKQDGVSIDNTLLVRSAGGNVASFTISQFNDTGGKTLVNVPDGTYEVAIASEDGKTTCTFTAEYRESNKDAATAVEVVATK